MDKQLVSPRTDLESAILELYQQLPEPKKRIMMLSAAANDCKEGNNDIL